MKQVFQLQPLDHTGTIITVVTIALALVGSVVLVLLLIKGHGSVLLRIILLLGLVPLLGCFVIPLLYAPREIELTDEALILKTPLLEHKIALNELEEVRNTRNGDLRGLVRTFGVGGLFGYYGFFHSDGLGSVRLFATSYENTILVRAKDKTLILSPLESSEFLRHVENIRRR